MIAREDTIDNSAIYQGLLIPITWLGVGYEYCLFEGGLVFCFFIFTKALFVLSLLIPLHVFGWVVQQLDSHVVALLKVHALYLKPGINRWFWGSRTYAP